MGPSFGGWNAEGREVKDTLAAPGRPTAKLETPGFTLQNPQRPRKERHWTPLVVEETMMVIKGVLGAASR